MGFPVVDTFALRAGLPTTAEMLGWVTGDPEALRQRAADYTGTAMKVTEIRTDLDTGLRVVYHWKGDAYSALVEYVAEVMKELDEHEAAMLRLTNQLTRVANTLATAHDKIMRILVRLATALIPLIGIAFFIPGPGTATALALALGLTAAAAATVLVTAQAAAGVLQGIPDVLNDLQGNQFALNPVGDFPAALQQGVPVGRWGPQPAGLDTGARSVSPAGFSAPTAPSAAGNGDAVVVPTVPGGSGGSPVPVPTPPTGPPGVPPGGFPGAGMDSGLPPGYGWAPPHAPIPPNWRQDAATGEILPPSAAPGGPPPTSLLPGYGWVAPGTDLPAGWRIDEATGVLAGSEGATGTRTGSDQQDVLAVTHAPEPDDGWEAAIRPGGSAFTTHRELATAVAGPAPIAASETTGQHGGMTMMPPLMDGTGDSTGAVPRQAGGLPFGGGDWFSDGAGIDPTLLEGVPG